MSVMSMDSGTGAVEESLKQGGATLVPNETLAADNANGVEVGVLEFQKTTPTVTGAGVQAHSKILIAAPKQYAEEIMSVPDQILDTIQLLEA